MRKPWTIRHAAALLACLVGGCHLVDQRDFDAAAGRKPVPHVAPLPPPPPALVTIRYSTPDPQYREAVAAAAQRALARKRDVLFTVTTLVPASATPDLQASQAQEAAASGRDVARVIVDSGASPGQVEQVVRLQPGLATKEVLVAVH